MSDGHTDESDRRSMSSATVNLRMSTSLAISDEELVRRLQARDESAFRELVTRYQSHLVAVARTHVSTRASAEEVVQETWIGVIRGIDRFEGRSSFKTWLFRIVSNRAKTRGVSERRTVPFSSLSTDDDGPSVDVERFDNMGMWRTEPADWGTSPLAKLTGDETLRFVDETLQAFPENQRMVVTLRDRQGWTSAEVCDALGITEANQRVLLHRGRSRLRAALDLHFGREGVPS